MPYIKHADRLTIALHEDTQGPFVPRHEGELNYMITSLCLRFLKQEGINYGNINAVVGALECAKLEMYARLARPYEDQKIVENGDVYPDDPSALTRPMVPDKT